MAIFKLLYLVRRHLISLLGAVVLGTLGHLSAIMIPVLGAYSLLFNRDLLYIVLLLAVVRAFLRYSEQYLNHLVAFKILAEIRSVIFRKLRTLALAIMESKDRGDLVSMVSSDVELLEVFYAHTISPLFIALLVMVFVGVVSPYPLITLGVQVLVGILVPLVLMVLTQSLGQKHRDAFAEMSSVTFEYTQGYKTLEQFGQLAMYQDKLAKLEDCLSRYSWYMSLVDGFKQAINEVLMWSGALLIIVLYGQASSSLMIMALVIHLSSFGPVLSLSALIQNLYHTFACANRVVDLLDETPNVEDIVDGIALETLKQVELKDVAFSYDGKHNILNDFNLTVDEPKFIGISGPSGCGKSTLVKLLTRVYDVNSGYVSMNHNSIKGIKTSSLRKKQSFMAQENAIFSGSILDNVRMVSPHSSYIQVVEACKKASIHEHIMSLEHGYDEVIHHAGSNLSAGEKQRLALARIFLHDGDLILLDEVTSNLDYLNERMIMKSLCQFSTDKIVLMISHRPFKDSIIDANIVFEC